MTLLDVLHVRRPNTVCCTRIENIAITYVCKLSFILYELSHMWIVIRTLHTNNPIWTLTTRKKRSFNHITSTKWHFIGTVRMLKGDHASTFYIESNERLSSQIVIWYNIIRYKILLFFRITNDAVSLSVRKFLGYEPADNRHDGDKYQPNQRDHSQLDHTPC